MNELYLSHLSSLDTVDAAELPKKIEWMETLGILRTFRNSNPLLGSCLSLEMSGALLRSPWGACCGCCVVLHGAASRQDNTYKCLGFWGL